MRRDKGHTMAELLCIMFILVIITSLVTLFINSSWRRIALANAVEDVQRSAVVSLDRFDQDISESSSSYVTVDAAHSTVFFPSPRDHDGVYRTLASGEPDWCCWVLYYLFPAGSQTTDGRPIYLLARKRIPGGLASPPGSAETGTLNGASVVARNITAFSVVMENPSTAVNYRLRVKAEKVYGGRDCTFELEKVIAVKSLI